MLLQNKALALRDGVKALQEKMSRTEAGGAKQRPMTSQEKSDEVVFGVCQATGEDRETSPYLDDLRCQLAQSFYWTGSFPRDLLFFICNWHPFAGMLLCHPCHPWSKRDRFMTFLVSCSITMLPSALLIKSLGGVLAAPTIFLAITLPVMVIEVALYWLSVGDIFFKGGRLAFCGDVMACLKHGCFCSSLTVSVLALLLSYLALGGEQPGLLVYPFLMSRIQSYVTWLPVWMLLPCIGFVHCWFMERRASETTYQTVARQ